MTRAPSVETILAEAVAIHDPADRAAYLDRACGSDSALRNRVERLAADHFRAGSFLEHPPSVVTPDQTVSFAPGGGDDGPGAAIGPYKLLEKVGEGGMGAVYVAEQHHPVRRKVALKVIKPGMDTRQVVARFEQERQALALMDHPHIARVLDGGTTAAGRPYFVMELVRGLPVTSYCDHARLPIPDRLRLFADVCRAVQHAHQKGVIHRDLKPSNVLVTVIDGKPVPKVIDFGIAKATGTALTDRTLHTGFHQLVGTPLYMAPEQAELSGVDVDTRADVYSLGVLLYELLTGTTPFDGETLRQAGFDEMRRIIREDEPAKPSKRVSTLAAGRSATLATGRGVDPRRLGRVLRGELDWVVMRCLDKDRNRRYQSPAELAADVERHLDGRPVEAVPPSGWYRLRKFTRRNRGGMSVVALAATVVLALGWAAADWGGRRAAANRVVGEALVESNDLQRLGKYPEALEAARRAEGLAAGGSAGRGVRDRATRRRADLELVLRLQEVRLAPVAGVAGQVRPDFDSPPDAQLGVFDGAEADRLYGEEFRAAGIDVDGLAPGEAGERIRMTTVALELAFAVDHWATQRRGARREDDAGWRHLLAVARAADPDGFRCRVRDALAARDRQALQALARAEELAAQPGPLVAALGDALVWAGAADRGVELLRASHQRNPADFWVNHTLALALHYFQPAQLDEALRFYTAALALRPQSPATRLNFANALGAKGRPDEAVAELKEAIRLKPDYATAHSSLAFLSVKQGRLEEALASGREAVRSDPGSAKAHYHLGILLATLGKREEAVASYREAIRLKPDYRLAYFQLASSLERLGRQDEAEASRREMNRLTGNEVSRIYRAGMEFEKEGKLEAAAARFREAIELDPDNVYPHAHLGAVLVDLGKPDEAVASYREAIRHSPVQSLVDYDDLIKALKQTGKFDPVLAGYRQAVTRNPADAAGHYALGLTFEVLDQKDEAAASYREAIRLNPDHLEAHYNLGGVLDRLGRYEESVAAYRRGRELESKQGWRQQGSRPATANWIKEVERRAALVQKIPKVVSGAEALPTGSSELGSLVYVAYCRRQYVAAAKISADWLAMIPADVERRDPRLFDLFHGRRYNAACAAVLAGCGIGEDAATLGEDERRSWRQRALQWQTTNLQGWTEAIQRGPDARLAARRALGHWQADDDLAPVRDEVELTKLPEAEQVEWRKLWADVARLKACVTGSAVAPPPREALPAPRPAK